MSMYINCKYKRLNNIIDIITVISIMLAAMFISNNCIYAPQTDMWCKIGLSLIDDFSNINRDTISWAYEAGLADIWVNHEFLTTMMMGICSYVTNYFFAVVCYFIFVIIAITEFIKNKKNNVGGNIVYYSLVIMIFARLINLTGFSRPAALAVIIYILFMITLYDIDKGNYKLIKMAMILILWSCCHGGSYPISLVTLIAFVIEDVIKNKSLKRTYKAIIAYLVTTICILIVPITRRSILYNFIQHGNTEEVSEWCSIFNLPSSHFGTIIVTVSIAVATIIIVFKLYRLENIKEFIGNYALWIMLGGTFAMGCLHVRYFQYFGCVGFALIPKYLGKYEDLDMKTLNLSRFVIIFSAIALTFCSNNGIFRQHKNAYDLLDRQKEIKYSCYDENYMDTFLKFAKEDNNRVMNMDQTFDDILINNNIRLFNDGRCDNMYKEPFHNAYALTVMNNVDEVEYALRSLRSYGVTLINMKVRNIEVNDTCDERLCDINWILKNIGGDIEVLCESGGEEYMFNMYLLKINY